MKNEKIYLGDFLNKSIEEKPFINLNEGHYLITGESGIGKTNLITYLKKQLVEKEITFYNYVNGRIKLINDEIDKRYEKINESKKLELDDKRLIKYFETFQNEVNEEIFNLYKCEDERLVILFEDFYEEGEIEEVLKLLKRLVVIGRGVNITVIVEAQKMNNGVISDNLNKIEGISNGVFIYDNEEIKVPYMEKEFE